MYNLCSENFTDFNDNTKIVVQKRCSNIFNNYSLTEKNITKLNSNYL